MACSGGDPGNPCTSKIGLAQCYGCNKLKCRTHLDKHHQEMRTELQQLETDVKAFEESLNQDSTNNDQEIHSLLRVVDDWERRKKEKIEQIAEQVRNNLKEKLGEIREKVKVQCTKLHNQILPMLEEPEFDDKELNAWKAELQECKDEIEKPASLEVLHGTDNDTDNQEKVIRLIEMKIKTTTPNGNCPLPRPAPVIRKSRSFNISCFLSLFITL